MGHYDSHYHIGHTDIEMISPLNSVHLYFSSSLTCALSAKETVYPMGVYEYYCYLLTHEVTKNNDSRSASLEGRRKCHHFMMTQERVTTTTNKHFKFVNIQSRPEKQNVVSSELPILLKIIRNY